MTDPEPRRLGGRYEIGEVLGYGGMAEVHRGRDVRLGRDVAIKMLRADLARDPAFQTRFRREAQSAASLNHPSIVAVYDTGEDDAPDGGTAPYIVMEFVDGRTLRDVLQSEGRLLPQRAMEITADVLAALDYSHRAGIIHRDIKPGNVMLTRSGDVKVMDFGIARALTGATSTMTQTAAVVGTAQYLSPEQARGEHVDGRSDIYSTGCLLYELLTGRPPFVGDSPVAVAYQHVREDPVPPSRLDPDIPPAVDAIVLKAMAKNPANRYQSAAEMQADVERAVAGRPVEATPLLADQPTAVYTPPAAATTVMQRVDPHRDRRRGVAYVVLGLAVLGVFFLAAVFARAIFDNESSSAVATPNLTGLTVQEAQQQLANVGLTLGEQDPVFTEKQPKGRIVDQNPVGGIEVNKGAEVAVSVSKGVQQTRVPDLVGQSQQNATKALEDAKLALGKVDSRDDPAAAGTVLEQNPVPGSTVDSGSKVDIVVASGQAPLPDVTGLDADEAIRQLQEAGFRVVTRDRVDESANEGTVLEQSPAGGGGRTASRGSTITLTVAKAAPSPTPTPSESASPSPAPIP